MAIGIENCDNIKDEVEECKGFEKLLLWNKLTSDLRFLTLKKLTPSEKACHFYK